MTQEIRFETALRAVEDSLREYPLTPLQEGMLFRGLALPGSGIDVEQIVFCIDEALDSARLKESLERLVDRHEALRTNFRWKDSPRPVQSFHRKCAACVDERDWRHLPDALQQSRFAEFLLEDRERGFDLSSSPLFRFTWIRTASDREILVWTVHHAIVDGRSFSIVVNDLYVIYRALQRGEEPRLEPTGRYSTFLAWLDEQDSSTAAPYWRALFAGYSTPARLGVDRGPAPSTVGTTRFPTIELSLSTDFATLLRTAAARHGVTPNNIMQGAWAMLLSRYSGDEDVVFGTTRRCRHSTVPGAETMCGLFINTLPMRVRAAGDILLTDWLKSLREQQLALRHVEQTSLEYVRSCCGITHGAPLFDSLLVFQNEDLPSLVFGKEGSWFNREVQLFEQDGLPLTVTAFLDSHLLIRITHDENRFDGQVIVRMSGHLQTLLEQIVARPDARLRDLPMLTDEERLERVEFDHKDGRTQPRDCGIHQLFEEQVERTPDAIALVSGERQLTYRQLNETANGLAHRLIALGVRPETIVGFCLDRSPEMIVALLAILKAGGAFLPLDPESPDTRLAHQIEQARTPVIITRNKLQSCLPAGSTDSVFLDVDEVLAAPTNTANPSTHVRPDSLAYVLYTSGSTGTPKGVLIEHRAIASHCQSIRALYGLTPADRVLQFANLSFDTALEQILPTLISGARLILRGSELWTSDDFLRIVVEHQLTVADLPTAWWHQAMRDWVEHPPQALENSLRLVVVGGEPMPADGPELWNASPFWRTRLLNAYGPTETTITATLFDATPHGNADGPIAVGIGRPLPHRSAYVLDLHGQLAPIGVPGELYIGGDGVARGYLNQPELTAEKFVPDRFRSEPGARLYRTGDLVRWRADGNLEFFGRLDNQIKLRGFRIELGEIEVHLARHPALRQVVVAIWEDPSGEKWLVAYGVPVEASVPPSLEELRGFLQKSLPEYMLPSAFVPLPVLPLTPSGKVDRKALPAPETRQQPSNGELVAPRTPTEELLAGVWSAVLGVERIDIHDNFFAIGGHSLLAMRVIARMRDLIDAELSVRTLFEAPTVAGMAKHVDALRGGAGRRILPPLPARAARENKNFPLSFAQERLWFFDQWEPGSAVYNIPWLLRLKGALHLPALERSLSEIVRRHEVLRTTYRELGGVPQQVIHEHVEYRLPVTDLRSLPKGEREEEARRLCRAEGEQPFDLSNDLMLRGRLLRLEEEEAWLALTMHHIASDGWSQGIFDRELTALYGAFSQEKPSPLEDVPFQYADYAVWQREWLRDAALESQLSYWKKQLAGAPALLELPTDAPRPATTHYRGDTHEFALNDLLTAALESLSRSEEVTLFMTLLAAFQALLSRYSGQEDITVGAPVAGRGRIEWDGVLGFFVNTLVLRTDLSANPTARDLLHQVRRVTLDGYVHQDLPFEKLVEALRPERDRGLNPLFQVMFSMEHEGVSGVTLTGVTTRAEKIRPPIAKFDLTLTIERTDRALCGTIEYNTDLFAADTIARMAEHYRVLLEGIVADRDRRVGELPLLTDREQQQLLVDWNDTARDYPRERRVHELFEEQAARTPDRVALLFGERQLTYRELNECANRIAHRLIESGAAEQSLIGLCLDRSPEMIAGILAILKTGAAYLPLDMSTPHERFELMLRDAGVIYLLTSRKHSEELQVPGVQLVCLDDAAEALRRYSTDNPAIPGHPRDLAYVMYTSGSTGIPKGVEVEHRSIIRLVFGNPYARFGPDRVFLLHAPASFDAATLEIWGALLHGAQLVIAPQERPDFHRLESLIRSHRVTTLWLTASLFNSIVEEYPTMLSGVEEVLTGGEALSVRHIRMAHERLPGVRLINGYGPTEGTTFTCCYAIPRDLAADVTSIPLGGPIANTRVYVLDRHESLCPIGVPGELYVGGDGVARGYLNQTDLTAEKFVPDRFSDEPGARLYRTGDLVRWRADGNLEFLGRLDHQVKLRGFRIELGEIEVHLARNPALRHSVVALREDISGEKRLVAYGVPVEPAAPPSLGELRSFLQKSLPEYMLPSAFVPLPVLPLTPSGKVDRKALPAPEMRQPQSNGGYVAPRNPTEELLAEVWSSLLGVERIGVHDSFFELGGHSLMAAAMLTRVRDMLHADLTLKQLFFAPTIAETASLLESLSHASDWSRGSSTNGAAAAHVREAKHRAAQATRTVPPFVTRYEDPDPFLAVIRAGENDRAIACVGDTRSIPFLLAQFSECVPVWHLKLDGTHVWPPKYLSLDEQVDALVGAIVKSVPPRPLALVGFSYGGLVAYETAFRLRERGWSDIQVMLIEPSFPARLLPLRERIDARVQQLISSVRPREVLATIRRRKSERSGKNGTPHVPSAAARWRTMLRHYLKNIDAAPLGSLECPIALVGTADYHTRFAGIWQTIAPDGVASCVLPGDDDHSGFAKGENRITWLAFFERWFRA